MLAYKTENYKTVETDEYYLLIDGETQGPFTLEALRDLWLEKEIPLDALYVRKGMREARRLDEVINKVISYQKEEAVASPLAATGADAPGHQLKTTLLAVLLLSAFCASLYGVKTIFYPTQREVHALRAKVRVSANQIKVTNWDAFDWNDAIVRLNDNVDGAYECRISHLRAGTTSVIPLVSFANGEGKHFAPWNQIVIEVWLGGEGFDYRPLSIQRE